MHSSTNKLALFACTLMLAAGRANGAFAKGGKHGHDDDDRHSRHSRHDHDDHHYDHRPDAQIVVITPSNRRHIRSYLTAHHCPPGLAKKHNGCVPPGHAKRYVIGQALPPTVIYQPVPQPLLVQLQPVPAGYQYVQVDQDVLLISEASHHVIDAITLLSAVR